MADQIVEYNRFFTAKKGAENTLTGKSTQKNLTGRLPHCLLLTLVGYAILFLSASCNTTLKAEPLVQKPQGAAPTHSPSVFLVMYDADIGKAPLLKAIKDYKCEIVYNYSIIDGMALKKPEEKSLEETMQYFKQVKGVTHVEYDHVYHLTDPVKPRLEIK